MIRRASAHDVDAVEQTYMELFAWERRFGRVTKWISGVYPSRTAIRRAAAKQELFALWDDRGEGRKIYASIALSREQPEEYSSVNWKYRAAPKEILCARMLCVTPLQARQTMGTQLLHYAVQSAAKMRCRAVRLDVWTGNAPMNALCKKLDFRCAGTGKKPLFDGAEPDEQNFYEYEIRPAH